MTAATTLFGSSVALRHIAYSEAGFEFISAAADLIETVKMGTASPTSQLCDM